MNKRQPRIGLIWATDEHNTFAVDNALPWRAEGKTDHHPRGELAHFKQVTMGHTVIMGRKTFESLGSKPLPGRKNIIISRTLNQMDLMKQIYEQPKTLQTINCENYISQSGTQVSVKANLEEALNEEQELGNDVWIIGGRKLLIEGFNYAEHLWHTRVYGLPHNASGQFLKINYEDHPSWRHTAGIAEHNWDANYWCWT